MNPHSRIKEMIKLENAFDFPAEFSLASLVTLAGLSQEFLKLMLGLKEISEGKSVCTKFVHYQWGNLLQVVWKMN